MSVFNSIINFPLDILFPRVCVGCEADGSFICPQCQLMIQPNVQLLNLPAIDTTLVATDYGELLVQKIIKQLKYHHLPQLARPLTELLIAVLTEENNLPQFHLLPIPLHSRRQRQRGYNQSELIAKGIGKHFHWSLLSGLERVVDTKHQAGLNRQQRLHNLNNAFQYSGPSLEGKHILLIDDVVTTGTTLQQVAQSLRDAHPTSIWAIAVARNREGDN